MIKKIYLFFFIVLFVISCGKKGDPVYKEKNSKILSTQFVTVL
tara:strand:+ start:866 stop:994 length:129 start_codon:yes stop_codon:yes gene_type:complete